MPITITVRQNGPYLVSGADAVHVTVLDHSGAPLAQETTRPSIALCRCGQSAQKPFCDGTHKRVGFTDTP